MRPLYPSNITQSCSCTDYSGSPNHPCNHRDRHQALGEPAEREAFVRRLRDLAASLVGPLRAAKRAEAEARTTQLLAEAGRKFLAVGQ